MKLGHTLGYKLGYIHVDYYSEFLSSNTFISKMRVIDKVLRKQKIMVNTRDSINTLVS